jgi:ABC-2 type transport system permease protein
MANIKREYWENKGKLVYLPLILASVIVLATLVAMVSVGSHNASFSSELSESIDGGHVQWHWSFSQDESPQVANQNQTRSIDSYPDIPQHTAAYFMAFFICISWLSATTYLLASLFTDRQNNSILFWKSLPFSETHNVGIKLFVGTLANTATTIVIAWVAYFIIYLLLTVGWGNATFATFAPNLGDLFAMPLVIMVLGALWGAPLFAYILLVSALTKRSPLMMLLGPVIAVMIFEHIAYGSQTIKALIDAYSPVRLFSLYNDSHSMIEFIVNIFRDYSGHMAAGMLVAAAFITVAIWLRNRHFEA